MRQDPTGMMDVGPGGPGGPGPLVNGPILTGKILTWFKKKLGDFKTWARQIKNENELPAQGFALEEVPVTYKDDGGKSIFTYASEGMYETNPIGAFLLDISAIGLRDWSPLGIIDDVQLTLRDEELDVHDGINLAANIFLSGAGKGKGKGKGNGRRPNIKTKITLSSPSARSLVKKKKLPTEGKIRFIPRKADVEIGQLLMRDGGYVDKFDNVWKKPKGNIFGDFHWDVQLSAKGKKQLGGLSKSGSHINVTQDGRIAH